MILLIEGIYILALLGGIVWSVSRIVKFIRISAARKEAEEQWSESFSEDQFQAFLETLRQKRDSQANEQQGAGKHNDQAGSERSAITFRKFEKLDSGQ